MSSSPEAQVRSAPVREMDPVTLYRLLRLRVDVFVVEQACPYPELDGRDLEDDAVMLWVQDGDDVMATLRLLRDGDDVRIGRVVTSSAARGRGLAAVLMRDALRRCDGRRIRLDAQAHLENWYGTFGFRADGPQFLEDGIPHVPMVRSDT